VTGAGAVAPREVRSLREIGSPTLAERRRRRPRHRRHADPEGTDPRYSKYPRRIDGNPYIQPILSWLDAQGISATLLGYDADAEDVLLEGFTGLYALSFDDFAGSTWLAFLRKFEDENGESRDPRAYNLTVVSFEGWTQAQAR